RAAVPPVAPSPLPPSPTAGTAPAPVPPAKPVSPTATQSAPAAPPSPPPQPKAATQQGGMSQRELYRNLMDALYDAVLIVDEKGHVVDSNTRVEHTFGYTTADMWDMPLQQLIKGFGPLILAKLAEPLSEGRAVIISGRGIRKDNTLFDAEITVNKVKLSRNETLIFSVRDITKRIAAIQEKAQAQAQANAAAPRPTPIRVIRRAERATA
ncbi:MAG: PAS domain S-box protein, partial [Kiritimatiellae bacterium]|nr:PAS domain S-box protein [Kiritimatiellia bacterium]